MIRGRTAVAAVAAVAIATAGCRGGAGDRDGPPATPGRTTSSTSSSPAPAPPAASPEYALPATIDEAYVDRVLTVLDHVQGDVFRRIVATGRFSPSELVSLRAVFNDPELEAQARGFASLVESVGRAKSPPGDNRTTVVRLLTARPDCVYAETTVDVSATVLDAPPPRTSWVALRPSQPGSDPDDLNPTPFSIAAEHTSAADPCG